MATSFTIPTYFTAVDRLSRPVAAMEGNLGAFVERTERRFRGLQRSAFAFAKSSALVGLAILAPIGVAAKAAIDFEDKMADVSKTTQITGANLDLLGKDLLSLATKTRTPIKDLQEIAAIGGQLGIQGRTEIIAFTDSVNKFNVALGSDFQGGVEEATRSIGALNVLFRETRGLDVATSITKTGSAINALSAKGVQVPELTEFTKRLGQLPDAIKPTIQETIALGAVFNKSGITAEIAARGLGDVLITASQNAPKFAKQMGISTDAVNKLLNTNPTEFLKQFSSSLRGINASQFSKISKDLKLSDIGSIKVIGSLSSSLDKLSEYQSIANDEFIKGTSLLNEYNTKNETTAAKIERAKNNLQALSIIIGTELLPIINSLLSRLIPIINRMVEWAKNNRETLTTIVKVTAAIGAIILAISAGAFIVGVFSKAVLIGTSIVKAYRSLLLIWTTAQYALNAAMLANPIGILIAAIAAIIAVVVLIIKYWDQWGASITAVFGIIGVFFSPILAGFALIVSAIQSFRNNWDMIVKAFKEKGILGGIMAIGNALFDIILYPMQQLVGIVAKLTGWDWAENATKSLEKFRGELGLNVNGAAEKPVNTKETQTNAIAGNINGRVENAISVDFKNWPKEPEVSRSNKANTVIPFMTSTMTP